MAKAVLNGVNPYIPVNELAEIWVYEAICYNAINHPSLHPPLAVLLGLPLGLLGYRPALLAWLIFELLCMLAALLLILRWFGKAINPLIVVVLLIIALGFGPVEDELWYGQLNACMLLLLVGSWLALRTGRERLGGALLGVVIALKWMAWPIVLFLVIRRRWKSVIIAALVLVASNLLGIAVLGFEELSDYYLKIAPSASYLRTFEFNLSASAFGLHLFSEFGWYHKMIPLWNSPTLGGISSNVITITALLIGLKIALTVSKFDTAFGLLTGLSILVSPVAWSHYLLLAVIPLTIIIHKSCEQGFPRLMHTQLLILSCPLLISSKTYGILLNIIAERKTPEGLYIVPFIPGLLLMLPTISLIGLLWIIWRMDTIESPIDDHTAAWDRMVLSSVSTPTDSSRITVLSEVKARSPKVR